MGTRLTVLLWPLRMAERIVRRVGRNMIPEEGGATANTWQDKAETTAQGHIAPTEGDLSARLTMAQLTLRERLEAGDKITLVDVREPHEVDQGVIPGAVHIPLGFVSKRFHELDPGHTVVVYCATGIRSMDAARLLQDLGFSQVHSLGGGFARWVRDGGSVSRPGAPLSGGSA